MNFKQFLNKILLVAIFTFGSSIAINAETVKVPFTNTKWSFELPVWLGGKKEIKRKMFVIPFTKWKFEVPKWLGGSQGQENSSNKASQKIEVKKIDSKKIEVPGANVGSNGSGNKVDGLKNSGPNSKSTGQVAQNGVKAGAGAKVVPVKPVPVKNTVLGSKKLKIWLNDKKYQKHRRIAFWSTLSIGSLVSAFAIYKFFDWVLDDSDLRPGAAGQGPDNGENEGKEKPQNFVTYKDGDEFEGKSKEASPKKIECPVCCDDVEKKDIIQMPCCGMCFCKNCVKGQLELAIKEGSVENIRCINKGCKENRPLMSNAVIREVLKDDDKKMNDVLAFKKREKARQPGFVECPTKGCYGYCISDGKKSTEVNCQYCKKRYCSKCQGDYDNEHRCPKLQGETTFRDKLWQMVNMKPCPCCGINISKTEGCNHMTCGKDCHAYGSNHVVGCGCHFCWNCGFYAKRGEDFNRHGFFCNRYPTNKRMLKLQVRGIIGTIGLLPYQAGDLARDAYRNITGQVNHNRAGVQNPVHNHNDPAVDFVRFHENLHEPVNGNFMPQPAPARGMELHEAFRRILDRPDAREVNNGMDDEAALREAIRRSGGN